MSQTSDTIGYKVLSTKQGLRQSLPSVQHFTKEPFGWNYKPAEKHCWLIFYERKILFRLKKQAE
jgi:hypothetical protein